MDHKYSKLHTKFLQLLMDRCVVKKPEGIALMESVCKSYNIPFNPKKISVFLKVINSQIAQFNMKIKEGKKEEDGSPMYVLVTLVASDLNKLIIGGTFSLVEVEYFERLVELIVSCQDRDELGVVSSVDALNMVESLQNKMSKAAAKTFLERLEKMQFVEIKLGMISLSLRAILELEQYLADVFHSSISVCKMCSVIVLCGKACTSCDSRFHNYCGVKFLQNYEARNTIPRCLSCGESWPDTLIDKVQELYPVCALEPDVEMTERPSTSGESRKRRHKVFSP